MNQVVNQFIDQYRLLHKGATVVVGVSGGPDSLALLHFLWYEKKDLELKIIVAHAEHGLRGKDSEEDLLFVHEYCRDLDIKFHGEKLNVKKIKEEKGISMQMAAREARYSFFERLMNEYQADYLALAQHGDDQVETMLMKQVRGSYGYGLAGIPLRRKFATGYIVRPFLRITKEDILHYCRIHFLTPRIDASNQSDKYTRNRFRKYILPFIKEENRNAHFHFQKLSEAIIEDEEYLHHLAKENLSHILLSNKENEEITISVEQLLKLPKPLQRRVIHLILTYLYGNIYLQIGYVHIEQILSLLESTSPNAVCILPKGAQARRAYDRCIFSFSQKDILNYYENELLIPGMIELEIGNVRGEFSETLPSIKNEYTFVCDANAVTYPLVVRSKLTGDMIRPIGLGGTKKVNRLFIDKKIERHLRSKWPIIVDHTGDILWVPTLAYSDKAHVTKMSHKFLVLTFEPKL